MIRKSAHKTLTALLLGASSLALAMPACAQEVAFADNADLAAAALRGERVKQTAGVTQLRLASGAMLSFVEGAEFQLRSDGSVDLFSGNVTVTGAGKVDTVINLAGQGKGKITGSGSSGSFSVGTDAKGKTVATGRVLTGLASIANGREEKRFTSGQAWEVANGHPRLAASAPIAAVPPLVQTAQAETTPAPAPVPVAEEPAVVSIAEGGPAAAAQNGVPVVLGEALAAAGASGDIVSAGQRVEAAVVNPALETFPSNDLAALVAYAAQLERLYGGQPFNQAQADVIRAYLGYLADGGSQAQFLTTYAGLMVQFLDLVRAGAAPSAFSGTSLADINAFISYRGRTSGFATLSGQNRVLVDAYLAFILNGGNADQFVSRYTSLTSAYFAFIRTGGDPLAFEGATQATLTAYITFLNDSGLLVRLAETDRALLQAYINGGGTAFITQYRTALTAYFAYISSGQLPSSYTTLDPAVLRQYLETLQATGLFNQVLGAQATFYAQYLTYLRTGGAIDAWQGLPVKVFAGYAQALSAYQAYLAAGGVPSAYTALDPATLRQYLDALASAGALDRFLGLNATFYAQYLAYLQTGGTIDGWQSLPFNLFTGYAQALTAYYEYLANGGLPSGYTALTQEQIRVYLAALQAAGANNAFLGQFASFYSAYFTFLAGGGNPDLYAGLPTPPDFQAFADAVSAYVAYLQAGGVPSAYTGGDLALLQQYIKALIDSGQLNTLLAGQAEFLTAYYAYLVGGGSVDGYTALPIYANYVNALEAYYAYLAGGGTPSGYTALTQAQILAYLKALTDAGVLAALFDGTTLTFIQNYYVYLAGGGNPDQFSGLPTPTPSGQRVAYVVNAENTLLASPVDATITADGKITRLRFSQPGRALDFNYATNANNVAKEFGHFGDDIAWTRYLTDTANNAVNFNNHLLVGTSSPTIPASGKIDYILVGGTPPTDYNAAEGTIGTFTGSLAVSFGSEPAVGLSLDVTAGARKWHVQTPGGSANPSNQGLLIDSNRQFAGFSSILLTTGLAGGACTSTCESSVNGGLFGADGAYVGFGYRINDKSVPNPNLVNGVAVFGRTGTALGYLGNAPASGGGGATSSAYTGGFTATSGLNLYTASRETSGWNSGQSAVVGSDGSFTGSIHIATDTARFTDLAGDGSGVIGRFFDGTFSIGNGQVTYGQNNGLAYALMAPITGALPTSGSIAYKVLSATKPFYAFDSTATGTFAANLTVGFGSSLRFAMDGTLTMADATYTFSTPGGATGALQAAQVGNDPAFFVIRPTLSASGQACPSGSCFVNFYGGFGGATPADRLGFGYHTFANSNAANQISGAVLFGREGTLPASGGTGSSGSNSATLTSAKTFTFINGGISGYAAPQVDVASDGSISRVKATASTTFSYGAPSVLREHGRVADAVAWSRWDDSTTNANLNPNTHILTGTPAVQLPASGKINYQLVGSTAPTNYQAPDGQSGTVTGSLAVQFGSQVQVGFGLDVQTGTHGWHIGTNGGAADPANGGIVVERDMAFASSSVGIARLPTSSNSCQTSCSAAAYGSLYGVGASHVGLGYQINDISGNAVSTVNGVVVFGQVQP